MITMALSFACVAMSQNLKSQNSRTLVSERIEVLKVDLNLSNDQLTKWKAVKKNYENQLKEVHPEKVARVQFNMGKELEAILTKEQIQKYTELRAQGKSQP